MLIFYHLLPFSPSYPQSHCSCFYTSIVSKVVIVGISSSSLFRCCWQRCPFLWLIPSASTTCRLRRLVLVVVGGVTPIKTNISFCSYISISHTNKQKSIRKSLSNIIFATGAGLKQPLYICIGKRFGWLIYFLLLN